MKSLYLRIWLTVLAALALFALVSGWLLQRHIEQEHERSDAQQAERVAAWGDLIQLSLPSVDATRADQAAALREWSVRLRLPLALDDPNGVRLASSESFVRRESEPAPLPPQRRAVPIRLEDGRTLWIMRPGQRLGTPPGGPPPFQPLGPLGPLAPSSGVGIALLLGLLFVAVAAGVYPVVRRLTRRLEGLRSGVEAFGGGALDARVDDAGHDEVAAVARSFNRAAARIEVLVQSHRSLLANASHELRSPLARMKMALAMLDDAGPMQRPALKTELHSDIAELDALVEEVLLASRLDSGQMRPRRDRVDLLALAVEEGARFGTEVGGEPIVLNGDERLLRRALRNLLENARRYGGGEVAIGIAPRAGGGDGAEVRVCDRGPGVPAEFTERIFEPFFRLPGHAEREGGVGLGLALVRQIARSHGGEARVEPRIGGGSCFVLTVASDPPAADVAV